ncbi:DUF4136 domain-containing protein [Ramlibacter albus]|uniref:DUF4136 domain-containing protein n=1 Tax=Ramlibacter albus TaxID=2079448 RepID=A0A923M8T7_9BURK|nr:DUF4136 domain-containing protein [Ramlibacter albus]MBC5764889.1 DUF4136 domain-containing protein [Ramlibacter albus]
MTRIARYLGAAAMALAVAALAGCSTTYVLDNQVQTFSHLAGPPAKPTYRFERLLSQQVDPVQAQLETLADPALHNAGFRRDDAAPSYSVQVSARVQRVLSPYADPWHFGFGFWGRRGGFGAGFPHMESPWYQREVGVVVRDIASNKVVYETRAVNDGPYFDNAVVLPAMFTAALQGFPNPPQGARRVDIPLPAR